MAALALLAVAVVSMFLRPRGLPLWLVPAVAAIVGVASTAIDHHDATTALSALRNPMLFLVFAVPLALLLDHLGLFEALAGLIGGGRHLVLGLWVLAALVTAVLNLDASVVLLTPLYLRIAHRQGLPAEALVFQPVLLAGLASSPLPVSNLTNLIVAERFHLGVGQFVAHLLLPSLLACVVAWWGYRKAFALAPSNVAAPLDVDHNALRRGVPIVVFVLLGFTLGDALGVPVWVFAAIATVWAGLVGRRVPWRSVPIGVIVLAASLGVLVGGAVPHLHLRGLLDHGGVGGRAAALLFGAGGADLANNLPAVLAGSAALRHADQVWPLLIGVNVAPMFVVSGALAGLLWRDTASRLGLDVSSRRFASVGVRVGAPAFLVAGAAVLFLPPH